MAQEKEHMAAFDASILGMLATIARTATARPRVAKAVLRIYRHQRRATRRRPEC